MCGIGGILALEATLSERDRGVLEGLSESIGHRVVELAFRIPVGYLVRQGWTKWILRKAVEDVVPRPVTWRRKIRGKSMAAATHPTRGDAAKEVS